jgi:hypothetical protein
MQQLCSILLAVAGLACFCSCSWRIRKRQAQADFSRSGAAHIAVPPRLVCLLGGASRLCRDSNQVSINCFFGYNMCFFMASAVTPASRQPQLYMQCVPLHHAVCTVLCCIMLL